MAFASATAKIWPLAPDWQHGVQESLAWGTDVMTAPATAVSQHRSYRATPRRSFAFEVAAAGADRRLAEMLLAGHAGAWQLPIWPDVQRLGAALAAGATAVPCVTAGRDFVAGGRALLFTDARRWEIVEVDTVAADHLGLVSAITGSYGPGARVYPLRAARVRSGAEERLLNDDLGRRGLTFEIAEACDWPELAGGPTYLGHDVLAVRPDEASDPTASMERLERAVDYGAALPFVHDLAGVALRAQQSHWTLYGREEHTWFRSLLYSRCGRLVPIWVPSFASDLRPVAPVAGGSAVLSIEWAGYTLFGLGKPNRRDLRIELKDGSVHYRRVLAAVEAGDAETLTLDASIDAASIAPGRIRAISFMALSTLASDEIEIDHATDADGLATATTGWQAVVPDV